MTDDGVRESRRKAILARAIVDHQRSTTTQLATFTREYPFAALSLALVIGLAAGLVVASPRD
jgi:hypothetical protein